MLLFHTKKDGFNLQAIDVLSVAIFFASGTYGIKAMATYIGMGANEEQASFLLYLLWAFVYARFLWYNKSMVFNLIVAEAIYTGILYLNYKCFPDTREYYEEYAMFIRQILIVYIPSLTVALKVSDFTDYIKNFRILGMLGTSFMILAYFMGYLERWEYQYYGVHICPFILMMFASFLQYRKRTDLIWVIVGFIFLMAGGRQSFVGFFAGLIAVYYSERFQTLSLNKAILWIIGAIFGGVLLILFLPYLIGLLGSVLSMMGMESRTLEMLTGDELTSTSSRDGIYELSLFYIQNNMFDVKGLFADRYMLRIVSSWMAYPHNLVLELMMDFGIVIGGAISAILLFEFAKRLYLGNQDKRTFVAIFATVVLVRLMVSSSFMIEGPFYTMLGLLFNSKDDKS